jgi:hypothetical protein
MDPPPSTSRADEGRGEGTREENDDENEKDDGRSVEDSRVHSKGLSRGHEHGEGGGHVRVHDSKIDLVPARALTRSMTRLTNARASVFSTTIDEVCWICLDGDTEGREVRTRARSRRESTRETSRRRRRDDATMPRIIDGTTENARETPNLRRDGFEIF